MLGTSATGFNFHINGIKLLLLLQAARFERLFGEKYSALGATSIQFLDFYESQIPITGAAAHAVVLSTPKDVFVAIRWA
jgi:hypothetical protein